MALGKRKEEQRELSIATTELPKSPGQWFYSRLNKVLREVGFDQMVEELCEPYYSSGHGRPSIPAGVYFRMLLVGYFEKTDLQWQIAWRWSDSLSLREFLGLAPDEASPDHSSLTRIRTSLPVEIHKQVFTDATLEALRTLGMEKPIDKSTGDDEPIALRSRQERQEDIERGVGIFETVTLNCLTAQKSLFTSLLRARQEDSPHQPPVLFRPFFLWPERSRGFQARIFRVTPVRMGQGSELEGCILFPGAQIGDRARACDQGCLGRKDRLELFGSEINTRSLLLILFSSSLRFEERTVPPSSPLLFFFYH